MRLRLILIMLAVGTLAACGGSKTGAQKDGQKVVAAFYPLAYAAQEVARPGTKIVNLTPPGVEPHDLELSPKDVQKIRSAGFVFLLGHGFQPEVESAAGADDRVIKLLDTPGLSRFENNDPHVWLDPVRYALLVKRIASTLGRPQAAAGLVARLRMLDRDYRQGLSRCSRKAIVTSHEAFGYLAKRYGLRQIAITGLSPEAEPTPKRLQGAIEAVRASGATTVFFETLVSPRIADTVARETGAKTAVLDPIEGLTADEAKRGEDYFSVMRTNLRALRSALGCR